jgi:predicted PurR-regulated permease PerM
MANINPRQGRAAIVILLLGVGLLLALAPFTSGLLSAPVFYVIFQPMYRRFVGHMKPPLAGGLTVLVAVLLVLVPGSWLLTLMIGQAQDVIGSLVQNPVLTRLQSLTVGGFAVGPELVKMGQTVIGGLGRGAFAAVGTAFFIL